MRGRMIRFGSAVAICLIGSLQGQVEVGAERVAQQRAIRSILHSVCAGARTPHASTRKLRVLLPMTRIGSILHPVQDVRPGWYRKPHGTQLVMAEVQALAVRLGRVYGLKLRPGVVVDTAAGRVRPWLADRQRKVALDSYYVSAADTLERFRAGLGDEPLGKAHRLPGWRVHEVDRDRFYRVRRDRLSAKLSYAFSLLWFFERQVRKIGFELGPFVGHAAKRVVVGRGAIDLDEASLQGWPEGRVLLRVERTARIRVEVPGVGGSRKGTCSLVVLPHEWTPPMRGGGRGVGRPGPTFTLVQGKVFVHSELGVFLTPPEFDPTRQFTVLGQLTPGSYVMDRSIAVRTGRVGVAK